MGHPDVAEAAVIGLPHPKWRRTAAADRRAEGGRGRRKEGLLAFSPAAWRNGCCRTTSCSIDELPHTATGKLLKTKLRETYRDHRLPTVDEEAASPSGRGGARHQ